MKNLITAIAFISALALNATAQAKSITLIDKSLGNDQNINDANAPVFNLGGQYIITGYQVTGEATRTRQNRRNGGSRIDVRADNVKLKEKGQYFPLQDPTFNENMSHKILASSISITAAMGETYISKLVVYVDEFSVPPVEVPTEPIATGQCDGWGNMFAKYSCEIYWSAEELREIAFELRNDLLKSKAEEIQAAANEVVFQAKAQGTRNAEELAILSKALACNLHGNHSFLMSYASVAAYRQAIGSIEMSKYKLQASISNKFDAYVDLACRNLSLSK